MYVPSSQYGSTLKSRTLLFPVNVNNFRDFTFVFLDKIVQENKIKVTEVFTFRYGEKQEGLRIQLVTFLGENIEL